MWGVCVCMCWCVWPCLFLYLCVWQGVGGICVVACRAKGQPWVSFLKCYPPWFLRQGFSLCLELADWAKSPCQQATEILLSLPPQYWDYKDAPPYPTYFWHEFWRSNLGPHFLKVSIIGWVSPSPAFIFDTSTGIWYPPPVTHFMCDLGEIEKFHFEHKI